MTALPGFTNARVGNTGLPAVSQSYSFSVVLTAGATQTFDLRSLRQQFQIDKIQGAFIDNSEGTTNLSFQVGGGYTMVIPTGYQALSPIFMPENFTLALTGAGSVEVTLLNFPVPVSVWGATTGGATAANQLIEIGYLATLASNTPQSSLLTGQVKIATTGTAVNLPANVIKNGLVVKTATTNSAAVTVGNSAVAATADGTGNGYVLEPGESCGPPVTNTNVLWINGTAGDWISWEGN